MAPKPFTEATPCTHVEAVIVLQAEDYFERGLTPPGGVDSLLRSAIDAMKNAIADRAHLENTRDAE